MYVHVVWNLTSNGCVVALSDKPGQHDLNLLKKLILPDGSILRAKLPGRPTRDCLFLDPARDGKGFVCQDPVSKVTVSFLYGDYYNLLQFVENLEYKRLHWSLGAFNCQGAGWSIVENGYLIHDQEPSRLTGIIRADDVDYLPRIADDSWSGDTIIYSHVRGELVYLPKNSTLPFTVNARAYEVFTVVPVKKMTDELAYAPIGLTKMFNSGDAIKGLRYEAEKRGVVDKKVCGCGQLGAYSSVRPKRITVDTEAVEFEYEDKCGFVTFVSRFPEKEMYLWSVRVEL